MKTRQLLAFLLSLGSFAHAQSAGYYLPPGVAKIRAMIVGGSPLQGGTPQYWRDYCAAQRVGLAQTLRDLPEVAVASGHPEIAKAPIVTIGTSAGANAATATALANPARTIAVVGLHGVMFALGNDGFNANRSGEKGDVPALDFSGAYGIPMIHNFDNNDGFVNPVVLQGLVEWGRAHGAPWTFFIHNDGNHGDNKVALNTLIFPWLTSVLDLRVPISGAAADGTVTLIPIVEAKGWLGDIKTKTIASYATYAGDKSKADWFPSQAVATIWKGYHFPPSYTIPAQPVIAPSGIVADLTILDPANNDTTSGTGWKINANFKEADQTGSLVKYFLLAPPPASVAGLDWIRPITPGKNYSAYTADPIFTFRVTADATVFIAHSDTVATRPAWLSTYTNTGEQLVVTAGNLNENAPRYTLFKKDFSANSTVTLGANGGRGGAFYLTLVKPKGGAVPQRASAGAGTPVAKVTAAVPPRTPDAPGSNGDPRANGAPNPPRGQNRPGGPNGPTALPEGTIVERDLVYGHEGRRDLKLDLYLPPGDAPKPLLIWIHGGAWSMGSKNAPSPAQQFVASGYAVAHVEYRFSQEARWPAQIQDCKAAVRWLRANAAKYHYDPQRFAVWGSSAGGHLVAMLGTSGGVPELEGTGNDLKESSNVQAVVDWFGPTDFLQMDKAGSSMNHDAANSPESHLIGGAIQENREAAAKANPITYIGKGALPPFLIMHGERDRTVPFNQSELLRDALQAAHADVTFRPVPGAGHGFGGEINIAPVREFLARVFVAKPAPATSTAKP